MASQDDSELKRRLAAAEEQLRESEVRHQLLIESWTQAVWETDAAGVVVADSPSWRAYTGQTVDEWLGYGWLDAIHPDDRAFAERQWREAIAAHSVVDAEFRLRSPDGGWRWTNVRAAPVLGVDGRIEKWAGVNIDIDDRKRAEAALRESEARYRLLFDSIDEGLCIVEMIGGQEGAALDYRFLQINASFERQTGLVDALGRRMRELAPSHEEHWFERYSRIARTLTPERFEDRAEALGRWYDVYAFPVDEPHLRRVGILFRDVIERKRTEQELARSNHLLRTTFDSSLQILQLFKAVRDAQGEIADFTWLLTNKQWDDRWGPRAGSSLLAENPAVVESGVWDKFLNVVETGAPITHELYYRHEQFDGWFLQTIAKADDGILLSTLDITDRKRAEAALRASEERYRTLFETMDEGVCTLELIFDEHEKVVDFLYIEHNAALTKQTGLTSAIIGKRVSEVIPDLERYWFEIYERVLKTGVSERREYHVAALDRWFDIYISRVGDGASRCIVVVYNDATERKCAEIAIRESEERQAFLLRFSDTLRGEPDPAAIGDRAVEMIAEKLNLDRFYLVSLNVDDDEVIITHEATRADLPPMRGVYRGSAFPSAFEELFKRTIVYDDVRTDPRLGVAEREAFAGLGAVGFAAASIRRGDAGMIYAAGAVCRQPRAWTSFEIALLEDATERTWAAVERARAEAALAASEEKYRVLFETMGQGYGEVELLRDEHGRATDVRYLLLNPAFERLFGIPVADAMGRTAREVLVGIEDYWFEVYDRVSRSGQSDRIELELGPSGGWYALEIHPRGGDRLLIVYDDITERKRAEQALRESEERFRQFGEASQDVLWIRDAETLCWTYLTPAFETIYGMSRETALEGDNFRNWTDLIVPEDRDGAIAFIERVRAGEWATFEYRIRRPKDGAICWLRNTDFPIRDASGRVAFIGGIGQDVTREKELAERQQVLVAELQHRTRNLMGVVRSMADRTIATSDDLPSFRTRFRDRLEALARVQGLLSRLEEHDRVTFDELIRTELTAMDGELDRVTLEGPKGVRLRSSMVQTLAMAVHELATNAVKYGAIKQPDAHLAIRWSLAPPDARGQPWLSIDWRESGVSMPATGAAPQGTGQGRELIEEALPYQLGAKTSFTFEEDGVHCTISLPVSASNAILEEAHA